MATAHTHKPYWGVQFHPESICTEYGDVILTNFRDISLAWRRMHRRTALIAPERPVQTNTHISSSMKMPPAYEVRLRCLGSFTPLTYVTEVGKPGHVH